MNDHTRSNLFITFPNLQVTSIMLYTLILVGITATIYAAKTPRPAYNYVIPNCSLDYGSNYAIDKNIRVSISMLENSNFTRKEGCPCAIDGHGNCRSAKHMCIGPNMRYICSFFMENITISNWGALIEGSRLSRDVITLRHETLVGGHKLQYWPEASQMFLKGIAIALQKFRPINAIIPKKSLVIPTRFRWDDCFNHLSFQSMPLIGMVYEFHPSVFYTAFWQCSRFTAALLLLLGVHPDKLIIEEHIYAKQVILPWSPYWNPYESATIGGISRRVSLRASETLLALNLSMEHVPTINTLDFQYQPMTLDLSQNNKDRFIAYFNRSHAGKRTVDNEVEILREIQLHLQPGVRLVVLPPVKEYKSIRQLHAVWQQYARIVNRAIVIMGPHGGGLNNLMWIPEDCSMIEFNESPYDEHYTMSHGQTPVRRIFLNGFWARSGPHNQFFNVAPVRKDHKNFYEGSMVMNIEDVMDALRRVKVVI